MLNELTEYLNEKGVWEGIPIHVSTSDICCNLFTNTGKTKDMAWKHDPSTDSSQRLVVGVSFPQFPWQPKTKNVNRSRTLATFQPHECVLKLGSLWSVSGLRPRVNPVLACIVSTRSERGGVTVSHA